MYAPYEDPIVKEKHKTQELLLKKAKGSISSYSKIVHEEAEIIRKQYKLKFKKVEPIH